MFLNASLHIKRLVAWRDLFVPNRAASGRAEDGDSRVSAHTRSCSCQTEWVREDGPPRPGQKINNKIAFKDRRQNTRTDWPRLPERSF